MMSIWNVLGKALGEATGKAIHVSLLNKKLNEAKELDIKGEHDKAEYIIKDIISMCPSWMPINEWETHIWGERGVNLLNIKKYKEAYRSFERAYQTAHTPDIAESIENELKNIKKYI